MKIRAAGSGPPSPFGVFSVGGGFPWGLATPGAAGGGAGGRSAELGGFRGANWKRVSGLAGGWGNLKMETLAPLPDLRHLWNAGAGRKERRMTRLMLRVAFGGEFGDPEYELTKAKGEEWEQILDVDAAAAELRRAGYEVFRMPEKYGGLLAHPLDDFIEAHTHIEGADNDKVIDALSWRSAARSSRTTFHLLTYFPIPKD